MTRIEEIKQRLDKALSHGDTVWTRSVEFSDLKYLLDTLAYEKSATAEAIRRIGELETALRYYADSYNYGDGNGLSWRSVNLRNDRGKRAREALGWAVIL